MLSAKVYLIIVSNIVVVNGKTVDKMVTEQLTSHSSYSECNDSIKSTKKRYSNDKKSKKKSGKYSYQYKTIKCKSKTVKLGENNFLNETFSIKW